MEYPLESDHEAVIKAWRSVRSLDCFQLGGMAGGIPPSRVQAALVALIGDGLVLERLVNSTPRFSLTAAGKTTCP
jgi:hypothetical protein